MSTALQTNDYQQILQDMADGVMVMGRGGAIAYLNRRALGILGVEESAIGQTLVSLFLEEAENDAFVQTVLDAVYNKGMKQEQMTPFYHNGSRRILEMSATYMPENRDVVLVFTDVTEREALKKRHHDSAVFVSGLFTLVCVSVLLHELLDMVIPGVIPPNVFTIILEMLAAVLVAVVYRLNGYTLRDVDLGFRGFKKHLPVVLLSTGAFVGLMCLGKVAFQAVGLDFFKGDTFLSFARWDMSSTLYPLTVLYQEVMTRSITQVRLKDVFAGRYSLLLSILISSLIFAAIHIAYGFPMMIGAFLLLSLFGLLYEKIGNVWLLCIVHYAVGTFGKLLGYF